MSNCRLRYNRMDGEKNHRKNEEEEKGKWDRGGIHCEVGYEYRVLLGEFREICADGSFNGNMYWRCSIMGKIR